MAVMLCYGKLDFQAGSEEPQDVTPSIALHISRLNSLSCQKLNEVP